MKLVHLEWADAAHHGPGEWVDPDDIVPGVRVVSVGFLLSRRNGHYTLAQSIDEAGNATGCFSVPHSAVKRYSVIAALPN
jgi:hypothetical protein